MRMVSLLALLLALCSFEAHPQEKKDKDKGQVEETKIPKEPVKNWVYRRTDTRYDLKTRTEIDELTVILTGKEAIPIDAKKKIFDLRGVKANYFTTPQKDKISKEIVIESDKGWYDHEARILKLKDNVRVVKKNDNDTPPMVDSVLTASSAVLKFSQMYSCPVCETPVKNPGRCLIHNEPLRETNVTNLLIDSEFELNGPEGIMTGDGLETDDEFRKQYHIRKNGFVEFSGDAASLLQPGTKEPKPPEAVFTQILSHGPLQITGDEYRRQIIGSGGVRLDRIDGSGVVTTTSDRMTIDTLRVHDPKTMKLGAPEILRVDAQGQAILDGVMFEDGMPFQSTSDRLLRRLESDQEIVDLTSTEIPVHVKSGLNTIESRTVRITRKNGETAAVSEFETVLRSDLVSGDQHFSLKSDHLTTKAEPNPTTGHTDIHTLFATGQVVLGGLMASRPGSTDDPGEAHADRFDFDARTQKGILQATPMVRITQGSSVILAPFVRLESPTLIVLKGPKQVTLIQEKDGQKEEYRATCDGDMVLDNSPNVNRLWMRNACVINTKDLLLHSDRVNAILSPDGNGLESMIALGGVKALRKADQTTVYGQRLAYRFKDGDLKVYGEPYAWADSGRSLARQEQIRVFEKENPKTKEKIRYTQMEGGRDGLRIEIESREKPGEPPKPAEPVKPQGKP